MPRFRYRMVDGDGTTREGEAESRDREGLVLELRSRGTILELEELAEQAEAPEVSSSRSTLFDFGLSRTELAVYTRQLATTLEAGLPMLKILGILRIRCDSPSFARLLDEVARDVQGGVRLSEALGKHPQTFDGMYVNLVKVGEASGRLPEAVARLADLLDKEAALHQKVRSALAYPSFILVFTALLSWIIVAFLMPLFAPMFATAQLDLRHSYPLTWLLLTLSRWFTNPLVLLGLGLCLGASAVGVRQASRGPAGRMVFDRLGFALPFLGPLLRCAAVARFARTLSTLLSSGLPLLQALNLVGQATGNVVVSSAVDRVANQINKGKRISDALAMEAGVFPAMLLQMTQVGEESGRLPGMLDRAADYFDNQLDAAVARLIAVLEPAMMVVVGGVVCAFVMAVLLPILGMATFK